MKTVEVPVQFTGTVKVAVADHLSDNDAKILAEKLAIAQMLATPHNEDCGEALECACEEFHRESTVDEEEEAERLFDAADIIDVSGTWQLAQPS
jgi:hypothetical protein